MSGMTRSLPPASAGVVMVNKAVPEEVDPFFKENEEAIAVLVK
jgi:hypothetical protein